MSVPSMEETSIVRGASTAKLMDRPSSLTRPIPPSVLNDEDTGISPRRRSTNPTNRNIDMFMPSAPSRLAEEETTTLLQRASESDFMSAGRSRDTLNLAEANKRLRFAIADMSRCQHHATSEFRDAAPSKLPLHLEDRMRDRVIDLSTRPEEDGNYKSNVLLKVTRICGHFDELVAAWVESRTDVFEGGQLCGYYIPSETVFHVDLASILDERLKSKLHILNEEFKKTYIEMWPCLGWSPVQWWFDNVYFARVGFDAARENWRSLIFQYCPKSVMIQMASVTFDDTDSAMLLLDMTLSYLGPMARIDKLDIVVDAKSDPMRRPHFMLKGKLSQSEHPVLPHPLVADIWASIWKWQGLCSPWDEAALSAIEGCSCCSKRRPQVRYYNIEVSVFNAFTVVLRPIDFFLDHRLIDYTIKLRNYWNQKMDVNTDYIEFMGHRLDSFKIEDLTANLGHFLADIDAYSSRVEKEVDGLSSMNPDAFSDPAEQSMADIAPDRIPSPIRRHRNRWRMIDGKKVNLPDREPEGRKIFIRIKDNKFVKKAVLPGRSSRITTRAEIAEDGQKNIFLKMK